MDSKVYIFKFLIFWVGHQALELRQNSPLWCHGGDCFHLSSRLETCPPRWTQFYAIVKMGNKVSISAGRRKIFIFWWQISNIGLRSWWLIFMFLRITRSSAGLSLIQLVFRCSVDEVAVEAVWQRRFSPAWQGAKTRLMRMWLRFQCKVTGPDCVYTAPDLWRHSAFQYHPVSNE